MDIFAHTLWAAAAASGANRKLRMGIRVGWAAWWGVFPDLFAFTVPVTLTLWERLTGTPPASVHRGFGHFELASQLYQISHSLLVFAAVFALARLAARRPVWELLGWPLHILIDIPTHTARFFPTPFLWPVSSYRFSGISWGNRWFMLANYSSLAIVYFLLWRSRRRAAAASRLAGVRS